MMNCSSVLKEVPPERPFWCGRGDEGRSVGHEAGWKRFRRSYGRPSDPSAALPVAVLPVAGSTTGLRPASTAIPTARAAASGAAEGEQGRHDLGQPEHGERAAGVRADHGRHRGGEFGLGEGEERLGHAGRGEEDGRRASGEGGDGRAEAGRAGGDGEAGDRPSRRLQFHRTGSG